MYKKIFILVGLLMMVGTVNASDYSNLESQMLQNYKEMDEMMKKAESSTSKEQRHMLLMQHMRKMDENMKMMKEMHKLDDINKSLSGDDNAKMKEMHMLQKIHMVHQKNIMLEMMVEQMIEQHRLMMKEQ